ncbi:MAG: hydrogenase expression/formation protein HypE [Lachnospiraceae bacterium]|nr:hydrogenase expression/formation protein HypE [Lachnospiraceae bacterium]
MSEQYITLAHGAGGKKTAELIGRVFQAHFSNPEFTADDAAILNVGEGKIAMTTDGFIVSPYEFPGGNIGKLSICGTVNDLSCMGAKPLYLTCSFVIEEGFPLSKLEEIVTSMERTAAEAGVRIVAGDTKVVGKGQADNIFITTTGIGKLTEGVATSGAFAAPGDAVIVTGDVGRHGCTILLAREELGIDADITSDCAPLWGTVDAMLRETKDIHVIRDATRGGVGTVLYEIAAESNVGIRLENSAIPVDPSVRGVCGMLGLDPLYLANEGTMVVIAPKDEAERLIGALHREKYSAQAAVIGEVTETMPKKVMVTTEIGSEVILPQPGGELLPRIC